jgi:transcriptional regulator with XRE-family HTH domain
MLNDALKLIRVFHNLKQGALAEKLAISQSHLSEVEAGTKQPTMELLEKYAEVFGMPVSSILYFSEKKDVKSPNKLSDAIAAKALQMLNWVDTITSDTSKPKLT